MPAMQPKPDNIALDVADPTLDFHWRYKGWPVAGVVLGMLESLAFARKARRAQRDLRRVKTVRPLQWKVACCKVTLAKVSACAWNREDLC